MIPCFLITITKPIISFVLLQYDAIPYFRDHILILEELISKGY